jgi:hypothetical protein
LRSAKLWAPICAGTGRDVDGLIANHALITNFDPDCVEENERIGRIKRALLPSCDLIQYRVCDRRYQVG